MGIRDPPSLIPDRDWVYKGVMRGLALAVLVAGAWLVPTSSTAQGGRAFSPTPGVPVQRDAPGPVRQPFAPSGRDRGVPPQPPDPPDPVSPRTGPTDQFLATPRTYAPRYDPSSRRSSGRALFAPGYAVGGYFPTFDTAIPIVPKRPPDDEPDGRLYLSVAPGSTQVFVDGFYTGTADDFDGRGQGLNLEAGPRRVELRADGFETVTFDVRIASGETLTYRKDLARLESQPEASRVAAAPPKTFYVIPRCYAGDSPPRSERLPAGCRVANVRRIPPVVSVARRR